ncbi:hypothetical protein [Jannaschia formosa]|uniref:hypothetical protein n=1 Tax=Jannaschia formosa TaxID=2259592 RepID=UPI000E1C1887|nr:hypothetical protein [Jannaschia formosa]TFL16382.1 hypothetical protein DR046_20325 [Jannaschia formosa]
MLATLATAPAAAQEGGADGADTEAAFRFGGDLYLLQGRVGSPLETEGDLFALVGWMAPEGRVAGDAHLAGFTVTMRAGTGGDLYAMGSHVALEGPVDGDASVSAGSATLGSGAAVRGNLRFVGGALDLSAPIGGSALIAGGEVRIDAPVAGDVRVAAGTLSFGPDARIGGTLFHAGPERVEVPEAVIPAERVTFTEWHPDQGGRPADWGNDMAPGPAVAVGGAVAGLLALLLVGAALLAMMPARVERWGAAVEARPGAAMLWGGATLAALFGLVPVLALTLVGVLLVPVALLALTLAWVGGWLLGTYTLGRILAERTGLRPSLSLGARIAILAAAVVVAGLLNFVPVLGWLLNLGLVLFGLGGVALDATRRPA